MKGNYVPGYYGSTDAKQPDCGCVSMDDKPCRHKLAQAAEQQARAWLETRGLADLSLHWPQGKPMPRTDYPSSEPLPTLQSLMTAFALSQLRAAKESGHLGHLGMCASLWWLVGGEGANKDKPVPCSCGFAERFGDLL